MGHKKGRKNVRKAEVPADTPAEFELGDTAADTQMKEESEQREREEADKQQREKREREEARRSRIERSESEMDTEGEREAGTSQFQSRCKKGDVTNIYVTDSDEEVNVDFVKDHYELYDKTTRAL